MPPFVGSILKYDCMHVRNLRIQLLKCHQQITQLLGCHLHRRKDLQELVADPVILGMYQSIRSIAEVIVEGRKVI